MHVLLDECLPHRLRHHLPGHTAATIKYMGWAGKTNGELIGLMLANGFNVLLTVDQNLPYQQNLTAAGIAVVVLVAASNSMADLLPLMPSAVAALSAVRPGAVVRVTT